MNHIDFSLNEPQAQNSKMRKRIAACLLHYLLLLFQYF